MDIGLVINKLNKEYGCNIKSDYYTKIDEWDCWWRGFFQPFHQFRENFGDRSYTRELYKLEMAKKVCEDWASVLLNEKTEIVIDDTSSSSFVLGADGIKGVLGANDFWQQGNALIEKTFYSGTGAFVLKVKGAKTKTDGQVVADLETKIDIDYISAKNIVPLSVVKNKITEAAFVSEVTTKGQEYLYLETHTLDNGKYIITNRYFKQAEGNLIDQPLPPGVAPRVETASGIPWFSLVYPNIVNNIKDNNGLGLSIYASAIDNLKGVDLAFNNFCRDFKLGGKKVFYNKELVTFKDGKTITPDDVAQQLFMQIGDGNFTGDDLIHEHNPDLRVEDNKLGVQAQLDYLSFKTGFGPKHYQFDGEKINTATEYKGNRQEMAQNATKHYTVIEKALQTLVRAILYVGKTFCGADVNPEAKVTINFEDSYIIDKEAERERDRQDVRDGLMQPWEYRVKWRGENEATAKAMISTDEGIEFAGE